MKRNGLFVKAVSFVIAVSFLWSNAVWAGPVAGINKLAAPAQAGQIGMMLGNAPAVSELMLANRRLDEWEIHSLADVFTKMDQLKKAGIKVLVLKDAEGGEVRYLFDEAGVILRVTNGEVNDDLHKLLPQGGVKVGGLEWFRIQDKRTEDLINTYLGEMNENWKVCKGITEKPANDFSTALQALEDAKGGWGEGVNGWVRINKVEDLAKEYRLSNVNKLRLYGALREGLRQEPWEYSLAEYLDDTGNRGKKEQAVTAINGFLEEMERRLYAEEAYITDLTRLADRIDPYWQLRWFFFNTDIDDVVSYDKGRGRALNLIFRGLMGNTAEGDTLWKNGKEVLTEFLESSDSKVWKRALEKSFEYLEDESKKIAWENITESINVIRLNKNPGLVEMVMEKIEKSGNPAHMRSNLIEKVMEPILGREGNQSKEKKDYSKRIERVREELKEAQAQFSGDVPDGIENAEFEWGGSTYTFARRFDDMHSNPVYIFKNSGNKEVIVKGGDDYTLMIELIGQRLFKECGLPVPEMGMVRFNSRVYLVMEYLKGWGGNRRDLSDNFKRSPEIMNALLLSVLISDRDRAPWNMLFNGGDVKHIDFGGAMFSKAAGGFNPFPDGFYGYRSGRLRDFITTTRHNSPAPVNEAYKNALEDKDFMFGLAEKLRGIGNDKIDKIVKEAAEGAGFENDQDALNKLCMWINWCEVENKVGYWNRKARRDRSGPRKLFEDMKRRIQGGDTFVDCLADILKKRRDDIVDKEFILRPGLFAPGGAFNLDGRYSGGDDYLWGRTEHIDANTFKYHFTRGGEKMVKQGGYLEVIKQENEWKINMFIEDGLEGRAKLHIGDALKDCEVVDSVWRGFFVRAQIFDPEVREKRFNGESGIDVLSKDVEELERKLNADEQINLGKDSNLINSAICMLEQRLVGKDERLEALRVLKELYNKGILYKENAYNGMVDLHCHTYYSDGYYTPEGLLYEAWRKGMSAVAIVDHNTIDGIPEAIEAWTILGKDEIQVFFGIEFDLYDDNLGLDNFHMVLYLPISKTEDLEKLKQKRGKTFERLKELQNRYIGRNRNYRERLEEEYGFKLKDEDLRIFCTIQPNRYQLGMALLHRYGPAALGGLDDFREVTRKYMPSDPATLGGKRDGVDANGLVQELTKMGVWSIAHPGESNMYGESDAERVEKIRELVTKYGIRFIEGYSSKNKEGLVEQLKGISDVESIIASDTHFQKGRYLAIGSVDKGNLTGNLEQIDSEIQAGIKDNLLKKLGEPRSKGNRDEGRKRSLPVAKKIQVGAGYTRLWQVDVAGGKISGKAPEGEKQVLQDALNRLSENFGPGLLAVVDRIKVGDNISLSPEGRGEGEGVVPYASLVEENGQTVLLLDVDAFQNEELLYLVLEHEFRHSIVHLLPGVDTVAEELFTNFMTLKEGLEMIWAGNLDINGLKRILPELGADEQFLIALETLWNLIQERKEENKELTDEDILAVAIEHMRGMPYYAELFKQFPFAEKWEEKIKDAQSRYKAALGVFNDIEEAKEAAKQVMEVKQRTDGLIEDLSRSINKVRMIMQRRVVWEMGFVDALVKDNKYIMLDRGEMEKPENKYIREWIEGITARRERSPFIYSDEPLPEGVGAQDVIYLVEPADVKKGMPKDRLYLPLPYSISSIYLAQQVVLAGGNVGQIADKLALNTIKALYGTLLGRDITDEELNQLFKRPWSILPDVTSITGTLNALRRQMAQIETAA